MLLSSVSIKSQKISFSGFGSAGFIFYDREILNDYTQEVYYWGKLQADIKINKEIEAQFDMRGSSVNNTITFREFSVKFKYMEYLRFKFGNTKKPFGYELLENTENLYTVRRSITSREIALLGYGGRAVSLMAYYNYSKKRPDFPYSYALSVFKDNSLNAGFGTRFGYHAGDLGFSVNYLLQNRGGEEPISGSGMGADITWDIKDFFSSLIHYKRSFSQSGSGKIKIIIAADRCRLNKRGRFLSLLKRMPKITKRTIMPSMSYFLKRTGQIIRVRVIARKEMIAWRLKLTLSGFFSADKARAITRRPARNSSIDLKISGATQLTKIPPRNPPVPIER